MSAAVVDGATRWSTAEAEHLLAFADDEHLIGQQHTEWIGTAPFLEEDLAFCSIAQDELGHAAALYELLGDVDALAFGREPAAYRSCSLVEVPCVEWELAIARHWLYDLAERQRWDSIAPAAAGDHADHPDLAGVIARARFRRAIEPSIGGPSGGSSPVSRTNGSGRSWSGRA